MPCIVLAIDGGGLRGIIPVLILKHIEKKVQESTKSDRKLVNYFSLICGTSTGGLIACALTLGDERHTQATRYDLDFIENLYRTRGPEIFPQPKNWFQKIYRDCRNIFRPRFGKRGIENVLKDVFGTWRISNCIKPIVVPTYDVSCNEPFYFSSREARSKPELDFELRDVCRATSAGPTYLPAHPLDKPRQKMCVDGGVFQNNPAITGVVEVLKQPAYNNGIPLRLDEIFVLSIGTGRHDKLIRRKHALKGGQWRWVKPIIDISMWGNSQAVDEHVKRLFLFPTNKKHYLRLNVDILEERYADMAISSKKAMDYYTQRFEVDYLNDNAIQAGLDQWLIDSGIVR